MLMKRFYLILFSVVLAFSGILSANAISITVNVDNLTGSVETLQNDVLSLQNDMPEYLSYTEIDTIFEDTEASNG